jgi:hypothetical protein
MKKQQSVSKHVLKVRTGLSSGYWTCTGVTGTHDKRGYYWNYPKAAVCYKPKYAPIVGAPAIMGGGGDS